MILDPFLVIRHQSFWVIILEEDALDLVSRISIETALRIDQVKDLLVCRDGFLGGTELGLECGDLEQKTDPTTGIAIMFRKPFVPFELFPGGAFFGEQLGNLLSGSRIIGQGLFEPFVHGDRAIDPPRSQMQPAQIRAIAARSSRPGFRSRARSNAATASFGRPTATIAWPK